MEIKVTGCEAGTEVGWSTTCQPYGSKPVTITFHCVGPSGCHPFGPL